MMAVRLPDNLGVSGNLAVPVINPRREPERCLPSTLVITIPIDGIPKVGIHESKEAEAVAKDLVGLGNQTETPLALLVTL
jgi:hypothetical protein